MVPDPGQHVPFNPPGTQNSEEFPIFGVAHVHVYLVGQTFLFFGRLDLLDRTRDLGGRPGLMLILVTAFRLGFLALSRILGKVAFRQFRPGRSLTARSPTPVLGNRSGDLSHQRSGISAGLGRNVAPLQ
eukprot:3599431-Pyramimonas_sp.AAC.1